LSSLRPHPVFSRSDRTKEHLTEQRMSPRRHGEITIAERHALIITYQLNSTKNGKMFTTKARRSRNQKKINRSSSCLGVFVAGFWSRLVRGRIIWN
jgi:hypothetical protein